MWRDHEARVGFVRGRGTRKRAAGSGRTVKKRFVVIVHGVVQGVYFRHSTSVEASRLGVSGAVRNEPDGTVRVVAEGDDTALEALLAWLRRGPSRAVVERVEVEWTSPRDESGGFRIEA